MTKLFQVLASARIACDASNDDLSSDEHGQTWSVPIVELTPIRTRALVRYALDVLRSQFRGYEVRTLSESWTQGEATYTHELVVYLSNYAD